MKLEEIEMNTDLKVVGVRGVYFPTEQRFIGRVGKVVQITADLFPIKIDFGDTTGLFKPEELVRV